MISVFLVEDNKDALFLLSEILESAENINFLGHAENGVDAIESIEQLQPNVVLMDIGLPDIEGTAIVKLLKPKYPTVQFVMCSVIDTDEKIFESIIAGASSYLLKNSEETTILETIAGVHDGMSPMNGDIARKMINMIHQANTPNMALNVTKKESEILDLLSKGHTYTEIADQVNITVKTLKGYIYRLYEKLQVDNRTEAVNKYFGNNRA